MDLPGGVHPDHSGVSSRGEGLAGPSPLFGEISMRGAGRPGASMVKDRKMLRFQADAWATEGKLFLIFFPGGQRNFAGLVLDLQSVRARQRSAVGKLITSSMKAALEYQEVRQGLSGETGWEGHIGSESKRMIDTATADVRKRIIQRP